MKNPLDWHKRRLRNQRNTLVREERNLAMQQARVSQLKFNIERLQTQINRAEMEGRDSFDDERYNIPRQQHRNL